MAADRSDTSCSAGTHIPVLLDRVCDLLAPCLQRQPGALLIDATVGMGGHCAALLSRCGQARAIGVDRDPDALLIAGQRLAGFAPRVRLVRGTLGELDEAVRAAGQDPQDRPAAAVVIDLGVSSWQLDTPSRGFSYARDAPLDMRMDPSTVLTAAQIINGYEVDRLRALLWQFGEERWAGRIAAGIVRQRQRQPITRTGELVALIREAIPAAARRTGGHPAKRTFQALRIEVNDELGQLRRGLQQALALLQPQGRCAVLAYHSSEDRIVKHAFAALTRRTAPLDLPVTHDSDPAPARLVTRGGERPDPAEVAANPRARSAHLRCLEMVT